MHDVENYQHYLIAYNILIYIYIDVKEYEIALQEIPYS